MKQLEILMVLTNAFDPDMRVYKEAKYLVQQGHSVEILCWDRENKRVENEIIDDIKIKRFYPLAKYGSGFKQIKPFSQFIKECKKYIKGKHFDYVHCHDLDGMVCGSLIKPKSAKLVFDMHEMYEARSKNKGKNLVLKRLMNHYLNKSDFILYVNPIQIENYPQKFKDKCYFLPNYPSEMTFESVDWQQTDKVRLSYIGAVRQYPQLKNLLDHAHKFEKIEFNIHGDGVAYQKLYDEFSYLENVNVSGYFDGRDIAPLYSQTDVHYIIYPKLAYQYLIAIPVKFYESIITKTPVIVGRGTSLEEFVNKYDIGFVIDGDNPHEINDLLILLNNNPELLLEKRKNFEKMDCYSWESAVIVMNNIYCEKCKGD